MDLDFFERITANLPNTPKFIANVSNTKIELKVDLETRTILVNTQVMLHGADDAGVIHECIEAQTN